MEDWGKMQSPDRMGITFQNVTARYRMGPVRTGAILDDVNVRIFPGSFTAIVGHTGAGKSSLLKTMNGLLLPDEGEIRVDQDVITKEPSREILKAVRKRIGMVFQFPESQLFAETVEKDIMFGPLNFGASPADAKQRAEEALEMVGLSREILKRSPFSLSGGQKRRVAIAGVLAMKPDILVLDEPGAGLDPGGKEEILSLLAEWHRLRKMTIVLVTHDMGDVARYCDRVIVMERGKSVFHGDVRSFFTDPDRVAHLGLAVPDARRFQIRLERELGIRFPNICLTEEELADTLIEAGLV